MCFEAVAHARSFRSFSVVPLIQGTLREAYEASCFPSLTRSLPQSRLTL